MPYQKILGLLILGLIVLLSSQAQSTRPLTKRVMVKTNLLNAFFKRPTLSIEKALTSTVTLEGSFVQGTFENFILADHYDFNGFLLRTKKYFTELQYREVNRYAGVYLGTLKRNIVNQGTVNNTGFFGISSRDFHANSIRGGGSVGFAYFTKSNIVIDVQGSLGYGRYIHPKRLNPYDDAKGYIDVQVWLSVGYCF
ncbi:DUF3575 domain-containing protein [Segetibacter aerophilus]|nr:DUF3575 domain-containing protein [Segetibacter aerophilus]